MRTAEPPTVPTSTRDWFAWRARQVAFAGFALFVMISLVVEAQLLVGTDVAVMQAKSGVASPVLYLWSQAIGIILSAEFSVVYTAIAVFVLLGLGLGKWALAPSAWLFGTAIEAALKLLVHQPRIPSEFILPGNYPLISVTLPGSFPSGHAMRTGFLFVFLAVLLWTSGGRLRRIGSAGLMLVAVMACYARVYMGHHWASDVVAGVILGASIGLLVAPTVARLTFQRGRAGARPR